MGSSLRIYCTPYTVRYYLQTYAKGLISSTPGGTQCGNSLSNILRSIWDVEVYDSCKVQTRKNGNAPGVFVRDEDAEPA